MFPEKRNSAGNGPRIDGNGLGYGWAWVGAIVDSTGFGAFCGYGGGCRSGIPDHGAIKNPRPLLAWGSRLGYLMC